MPRNADYAFASSHHDGYQPGMTLRQWYAGLAIQVVGPALLTEGKFRKMLQDDFDDALEQLAKSAFLIADAMIVRDQKTTKPDHPE